MYVPKKSSKPQAGINNNNGEYEGIWSGPIATPVSLIRPSHKLRPEQQIAKGYEDVPIRIQHIDNDHYVYQIVDGNKRLRRARQRDQIYILAYIWEGRYYGPISIPSI